MNRMKLTNLDVSNCEINVKIIKSMINFDKLTTLNASQNLFTDEMAQLISQLKNLTSLDISKNYSLKGYYFKKAGLTITGVQHLCEMKNLKILNISQNFIKNDSVELISKLKQLTILDISKNLIEGDGIKYVGEMEQLRILNIDNNQIGGEHAKYISQLKQINTTQF